jgi:hypothetical protein
MLTGGVVWARPDALASNTDPTNKMRTLSVEGYILLSATPDGNREGSLRNFCSRDDIL